MAIELKVVNTTIVPPAKHGDETKVTLEIEVTENSQPKTGVGLGMSFKPKDFDTMPDAKKTKILTPPVSATTDADGKATIKFESRNRSVSNIFIVGEGEVFEVQVDLKPKKTATAPATPTTAPPATPAAPTPSLLLGTKATFDNTGKCQLLIQVVDRAGKGIKMDLVIASEGAFYQAKTDKDGKAVFDCPRAFKRGEEIKFGITGKNLTGREFTVSRPAAAQPKTSLKAHVLSNARGRFSIKVRVTDEAGNGLKTSVYLSSENLRHEVKTDKSGEAVFNYPRTIARNESLPVVISVPGITEQETVILSHVPLPKTDPVQLNVRQSHDGFGNYTVFFRITDHDGNGLEEMVTINYRDRQINVKADCHGQASWQCPDNIQPGCEEAVTAAVSGITETATIKLRRRSCLPPMPSKRSLRWWFGVNNGRAIIFLAIMVTFWIKCYSTIPDGPIIHKPTQQTVAEHNFDEVTKLVEAARTKNLAQLDKAPNFISQLGSQPTAKDSKKPDNGKLYLFTIIWTVFTFIYAILSLREEFADGLGEVIEKMRSDEKMANDPLVERLAARLDIHKYDDHSARATSSPAPKPAQPVTTDPAGATTTAPDAAGTTPAPAQPATSQAEQRAEAKERRDVEEIKKRVGFWEQFKVETFAEIAVAAIPKILARIFR